MVGHDIVIDKMGAFRLTFRTRAPNYGVCRWLRSVSVGSRYLWFNMSPETVLHYGLIKHGDGTVEVISMRQLTNLVCRGSLQIHRWTTSLVDCAHLPLVQRALTSSTRNL